MKVKIIFAIVCLSYLCFVSYETMGNVNIKIPVNWVSNLSNDFSFKNKWSYPEGVFRNNFGQLSCDAGICEGIDGMKDDEGRILKDSIEAFYHQVDTTHLKHTLKSKAQTYEWYKSNFIVFKRLSDNSIIGKSVSNTSTHSSLIIKIENDSVSSWIDFKSITNIGRHKFPVKKGVIKIDESHLKKGIIKAEFNLTFLNTIDENKELYWKGLIYSEIKK